MTHEHCPVYELCVRAPRIALRYPDDDDVMALADLAADGIHDPSTTPFSFPWTDVAPPLQQRGSIQHLWSCRANWRTEQWHLPFAVVVDEALVGVQEVNAHDFAVRRTVATGSWLGRAHQDRGIGREMRAAVLHFAFDGLGAQRAESGAFSDNTRSLAVSRRLGYRENGNDIDIVGLDACRPLFGLMS